MSCCKEALFESYVNMLHQHCNEAPGTYSVLQEVLQRAIKEFPNNIYLLTTAAKLQVSTVLFIVDPIKNANYLHQCCGRSQLLLSLPSSSSSLSSSIITSRHFLCCSLSTKYLHYRSSVNTVIISHTFIYQLLSFLTTSIYLNCCLHVSLIL